MAEVDDPNRKLARLAVEFSNTIERFGVDKCYALISCGKSKADHPDLARHLYDLRFMEFFEGLIERQQIILPTNV